MIYGYARVSTRGQKLESQVNDLKKAGAEKIYQEKFTGTTVDRPKFDEVLEVLQKGDTLVVTKLDRFARNTKEALDTVQDLFERGIKINVLNLGQIDNSPTGKLIFTVFSAFADFERDLIVSRMQEGKEWAKEHDPNFHEGMPRKYDKDRIQLAWNLRQKQHLTYKEIAKQTGISEPTLYRRFREIKEQQALEESN